MDWVRGFGLGGRVEWGWGGGRLTKVSGGWEGKGVLVDDMLDVGG